MPKRVKWSLTGLVLSGVLGLGLFLRIYRIDNHFLTCETHNFMMGIRAHTLPLWNISAGPFDNFFKAFFYPEAGMRYVVTTYFSTSLYRFLGIPVTEYWLLAAHAFIGTVLILVTYLFGTLLQNSFVGMVAAFALAVHRGAIASSRWDNAEPSVSLAIALSFYLLFLWREKQNSAQGFVQGLVLCFLVSTESLLAAPLYALCFAWLQTEEKTLWNDKGRLLVTRLFKKEFLFQWLLPLFVLFLHFKTYMNGGKEGYLGLFGFMGLYSERLHWNTVLPRIQFVWNHYAKYYSPLCFLSTALLAFLFAAKRFFTRRSALLGFPFLGSVYFFAAFIAYPSTLVRAEHLYLCDWLSFLLFGSVLWESYLEVKNLLRIRILQQAVTLALVAVLLWWAGDYASGSVTTAISRTELIHSEKAVGFYIRENGKENATVLNMRACGPAVCLNHLDEYYLGKQVMESHDPAHPRTIFCLGEMPVETVLKRHNLKDFDFYVVTRAVHWIKPDGQRDSIVYTNPKEEKILQQLLSTGGQKVAEVTYRGEVLSEIYSRSHYPFASMDVEKFDKQWANKYARLNRLLGSRYAGLVSTFGEHWNLEAGD